jgi:hypothetical protein
MKLFIWLNMLFFATAFSNTATAAFQPSESHLTGKSVSQRLLNPDLSTSREGIIKPSGVKGKYGLKGRLMTIIQKSRVLKKLAGIDEPTERQRKLGRLSLIFGGIALILLVIPYAALALPAAIGVLSVPSAIAGMVLGIKSVRGNSNLPGLLGLILSASLLLLMILAVIFLALFFSTGWI